MSRPAETCALSLFLNASWNKPEEQATAILACALRTSDSFARALLARLNVVQRGRIDVSTEVRTGAGRDRIDLQLKAENERGGLVGRTWLEVKVDAKLAAAVASNESHPGRDPQLTRYRRALDERDRARPDLQPSVLALLVPSETAEDRKQASEVGSPILRWSEVGDLAAERAREIAGGAWRQRARKPEASLELANLETLVWFLEEADRPTSGQRRPFVEIDPVTEPVTPRLAERFGQSHRSVLAVQALVDRAVAVLEEDGWRTVGPDEVPDVEDYEAATPPDLRDDELEWLEDLTLGAVIDRDLDTPWWSGSGRTYFQVCPFDESMRESSEDPVIQVGLIFPGEAGPVLTPTWLEQLDKLDFRVVEHPESLAITGVLKTEPLASMCNEASSAEQAKRLAGWVTESLSDLADTVS